jgi:multidrug efflux pump subunit AcrA (membrane-fusion protein)
MTIRRLLLLIPLLLIPACAPKAADTGAPREQDPVPVTVVPLSSVTLKRTVPVVGTLDPYKEVTLAPKVDGRVLRVRHDVGDVVYPGDVLLELDATDYELDVQVARAGLDAEVARAKQAEKSVGRAAVTLDLARKDLARVESGKGSTSKQELDKAKAEVDLAAASKEVAEADQKACQATADRMRVSRELAEQRLRDTVLRAPVPEEWAAWAAAVGPAFTPFRYRVAQRMVWEGEMVRGSPEKNAFRLVIDHALKLRAAVPEKFAPDVRPGQPVEVRVDAYGERVFAGTVVRVSPTVDAQNRTFQVEVVVGNSDPRWQVKAGSFARADLLVRIDSGVATVPPEAVVSFAGVNKVFVADGERAKAIEVQLGQRDRAWVEVIGPLPADAKVITSGFSQLVDGSPIRIR